MDCVRGFDRRFSILNLVDKMKNTFVQSRIAGKAAETVSSVVSSEPPWLSLLV